MKKILLFLSLMLTLFNMKGSAFVRYVTTNLNMRYGPGTNYGVITMLPSGTSVEIDEDCDCKWVLIEYHGTIGYVSTKYLSKVPSRRNVRGRNNTRIVQRQIGFASRSGGRYYINVDGYRVQSPTYYDATPAGARALCRDGSYSFSRNRRGTCSHHGGVARWL